MGALRDSEMRTGIFRWIDANENLRDAECPCCGFVGRFSSAGVNLRLGTLCPSCKSYERHRLLALAFERGVIQLRDRDVLHFGPAKIVSKLIDEQRPRTHVTGDINPGKAQRVLDLEAIDLPEASFDIIMASHVLEHVDDRKALPELFRVLRPGGQLLAIVPLVEGWPETFEDPAITSPEDRTAYYGRFDHVRFYGADFRDRLRSAGFALEEFTAGAVDSVRYRLALGDKVFIATRPA